jgi:hypothetical protein
VQTGMGINKTLPECKNFLFQLMDLLEAVKFKLFSKMNHQKVDRFFKRQRINLKTMKQFSLKLLAKHVLRDQL